ncbi:hypothetical protein [Permianibacter aggregans]|uniref:Uncharacterized protein n=1 Tax=Permianibacter aggregans TaxID=1510150 RepID=A0A4R6UFV7_9GAMM|nr:hypothetical protein [Permianibacter aggregans]QGX38214.1 hypothetical protein E2H98_00425 [Permianibacter aggregans]TDQ44129.1 hypothetical protein EV696_12611 [Permianibacter aggregans]
MTEILSLLALIFLPILIPILAVAGILGSGSWGFQRFKSTLALNEESGLFEQGLLWVSILSPFLYFLALGVVSWDGYSVSVTSEGLKKFLSISALPLGALSLALPLSVLVSRLHATKQTAKQIKITQQKNNLDLFHSHRKELFSYFGQIGDVQYLDCLTGKFKVHPRVHKVFFTGRPENGVPLINEDAFKDIEKELSFARWQLDAIIRDVNPQLTYSFYIANFCSTIYRLSEKLGLPEIYVELAQNSLLVPTKLDGREPMELLTVGKTTDEAVAAYRYAKGYFHNLCDFAGREQESVEDDGLKYIDAGGKFRTIKAEKVIERLHQNEIPQAIAAKA